MSPDIPLIYLYLYLKVKENVRGNIIDIRDLHNVLSRTLKFLGISRSAHLSILAEFEGYLCIKKLNLQRYEILCVNCKKLKQLEQALSFL